ncbi:type II toxin-antitoxin system Phd/YefM family antitoxin [Citrobacter amalonaticus]|uniref:type II toxin-antitoxin system Phd/YefM family antitoxin n=1 Tax=Citrobacter amalonaticus TaxID=35703 RepID=UPI00163DD329|nr:type II toxin-antitoxin system prevent-host-death family antitoxin [Citrobacter amalonaticus]
MKKITYTHMREHLTEVLEALRNGESFTVTQRGKPDLILQGRSVIETGYIPIRSAHMSVPPIRESGLTNRAKELGKHRGHNIHREEGGGTVVRMSRDSNSLPKATSSKKGLTFSEAKERTKARHAGVIKMLGDK